MPPPIVALVGRPNVGKSTLFNRIIGQRQAIVEDLPGTTRDRLYGDAEWNGVPFTVVDTGGLEIVESQKQRAPRDRVAPLAVASAGFIEEIRHHAEIAIEEADVIILLVDVLDGLTPADEDVAEVLRRTNKPVLVAANKADNPARQQAAFEFYALGLRREDVRAVIADFIRESAGLLEAIIQEGIDSGELEPTDARLAARVLDALLSGTILHWVYTPEETDVDELLRYAVRLVFQGLLSHS